MSALAWAIGLPVWVAAVAFLRGYRIWLFYYVVATVGGAYALVALSHDVLGLDVALSELTVRVVNTASALLGVPTRTFDHAPGVLMVMVISQSIGWTLLQVGVESSGMLETCVISSLLLFYPGWGLAQRASLLALGIGATWAANVLRLLIIALMLHYLGKDALVLAHTFVGKAVFFVFAVGIYAWLITFPTVTGLAARLRGGAPP